MRQLKIRINPFRAQILLQWMMGLFFLLVGCRTLPFSSSRSRSSPESPSSSLTSPGGLGETSVVGGANTSPSTLGGDSGSSGETGAPSSPPLVGVILGPGGFRSYAQVGVLQELMRSRIKIHAIGGIEMGSLVGALVAYRGQVYDGEWQMFKIKKGDLVDRRFFSRETSPMDPSRWIPLLKKSFGENSFEKFKIPFVCPSFRISDGSLNLVHQGSVVEGLPSCLSSYPLSKPYAQSVSGWMGFGAMVQHMRSQGIHYLIYVDVIPEGVQGIADHLDSETQITWSLLVHHLREARREVNQVIEVPLGSMRLDDFDRRREAFQRGKEMGRAAAAAALAKGLRH